MESVFMAQWERDMTENTQRDQWQQHGNIAY